MVLGIHSYTEEKESHLYLSNLPSIAIRSVTDYIVEDFNKENYIFPGKKIALCLMSTIVHLGLFRLIGKMSNFPTVPII